MDLEYEMTYKEIAKELGLSRQTIAHIEKTALKKLRNKYSNLGVANDNELINTLRKSQREAS